MKRRTKRKCKRSWKKPLSLHKTQNPKKEKKT
jgi:hypothetical protein